MGRRQQLDLNHPRAERMLEEEAKRYGLDANLGGFRAQGSSSSNLFCFGRSSGERVLRPFWGAKGGILIGNQTEVQEGRKEAQINWEESSLVKFSQFWASQRKGVNDSSKRKVIKSVIRNQKVDLFCIQETKMAIMSEGGGGVLICWDKRSLEMLGLEDGQFSISCRFRNVEMEQSGCSRGSMVLSPEKIGSACGRSLGAIRGLWEEPWCLGGDFNTTLYQAERSRNGGSPQL
ncbi:hypothetical protein CK203_002350 [Vitis vinifera]|uniref:Endonuclease/exonuclease/phosphatase domain-containing protein n=1 Tax=Vitis vinifera TaxID=29760 RepID=A0A438KK92_VITVI|nr:hypothetical protein CK203_002350 [Vitis vinifera]